MSDKERRGVKYKAREKATGGRGKKINKKEMRDMREGKRVR